MNRVVDATTCTAKQHGQIDIKWKDIKSTMRQAVNCIWRKLQFIIINSFFLNSLVVIGLK